MHYLHYFMIGLIVLSGAAMIAAVIYLTITTPTDRCNCCRTKQGPFTGIMWLFGVYCMKCATQIMRKN